MTLYSGTVEKKRERKKKGELQRYVPVSTESSALVIMASEIDYFVQCYLPPVSLHQNIVLVQFFSYVDGDCPVRIKKIILTKQKAHHK